MQGQLTLSLSNPQTCVVFLLSNHPFFFVPLAINRGYAVNMAREYHGKCHIRRLCSWNWGFFIPKSDYQKGMIKIPDKLGRILHLNPLYHLWPNDVWCTNVGEVIWIHWTIPIWIQSIINWTSPWNVLTYATFCRTYGHQFDVVWWMCVKQPGPTGLGLGECWGFPQENLQRNI